MSRYQRLAFYSSQLAARYTDVVRLSRVRVLSACARPVAENLRTLREEVGAQPTFFMEE